VCLEGSLQQGSALPAVFLWQGQRRGLPGQQEELQLPCGGLLGHQVRSTLVHSCCVSRCDSALPLAFMLFESCMKCSDGHAAVRK